MPSPRSTFFFTGILPIALLLPAIASAQLSETPDRLLSDAVSTARTIQLESNLFTLPLVGTLREIGYRVSSSDGKKFDALTRHALFMDLELPWYWSGQSGFSAEPFLSLEVGRFSHGSEHRSFISFGPLVRLTHQRWGRRLFVDAGLSPTVIDGAKYGERDFGTSFNFTSHVGLGSRFGAKENHFVKFRYEHISNGGIDENNPGVNMVGLDFVFWAK